MPVDSVELSFSKHTISNLRVTRTHVVCPNTPARFVSRCPRHSEISGAAIFHSGYLSIFSTVFAGNKAGQDGTAVFSIGVVEEAQNVTFDSNTLSCPLGDYGYDKEVIIQHQAEHSAMWYAPK